MDELRRQILSFVDTFTVVETDQLLRFFSDQDVYEVDFEIRQLIYLKILYKHKGDRLSTSRKLFHPPQYYDDTIKALHVLCSQFRSSDVTAYSKGIDPVHLKFHTLDGKGYDVVVFDRDDTYISTITFAYEARKADKIPGLPDCYTHIAVVNNLTLAGQLEEFNFSLFALVDEQGNATIYSKKQGE